MKEGNRSLSIASINPDNFAHEITQTEITEMLLRKKIHIAAIQETHIPRDLNYKLNGYRIITSAAIRETNLSEKHENTNRGLPNAGVAILIHEELEHHVVNIQRIDGRIIKVTLHSKKLTYPAHYSKHICATLRKNKKNNKKSTGKQ